MTLSYKSHICCQYTCYHDIHHHLQCFPWMLISDDRVGEYFRVILMLQHEWKVCWCRTVVLWQRSRFLGCTGDITVSKDCSYFSCMIIHVLLIFIWPPDNHQICHNDAHVYYPGHRSSQGLTLVLCYIINKWWILSIIIYIMQSRIYRSKLTWNYRRTSPIYILYYIHCFYWLQTISQDNSP